MLSEPEYGMISEPGTHIESRPMAADREFEYIVWCPAFVSGALHVNLGAASLERSDARMFDFLSCFKNLALKVFKNLMLSNFRAQDFDRGLSFASAECSNTIGVTQNASSSSETLFFLLFLVRFSLLAPKMLVFLMLFVQFL